MSQKLVVKFTTVDESGSGATLRVDIGLMVVDNYITEMYPGYASSSTSVSADGITTVTSLTCVVGGESFRCARAELKHMISDTDPLCVRNVHLVQHTVQLVRSLKSNFAKCRVSECCGPDHLTH